jgi:hypothetical protein
MAGRRINRELEAGMERREILASDCPVINFRIRATPVYLLYVIESTVSN